MRATSRRELRGEPESSVQTLNVRIGPQTLATECLTEDQVVSFVEGRLDKGSLLAVDGHLSRCPGCAALVCAVLDEECRAIEEPLLGSRNWTLGAGTVVAGRYLIQGPVGSGGMGEVYEGFDLVLERRLALKTAKATRCDQPDESQRLASEFAFARRIEDPNVCRVFEVGVHRDARPGGGTLAFLTMELIEGTSLDRLLKAGPLEPAAGHALARELLRGAAAIHRGGVIHRDIKSHNVVARNPASLSIIDFGLAVDLRRSERTAARVEGSSCFSLEGSPAYMAPEQFREAPITPATDVFACGVVIFEALTGALPFRSLAQKNHPYRDPAEVPLRAREVGANVSHEFDQFIKRCLELDPKRRPATAAHALALLDMTSPD